MSLRVVLAIVSSIVIAAPAARAQDKALPDDVAKVLMTHCSKCHTGAAPMRKGNREFDVMTYQSLLETKPKPAALKRFAGTEMYVAPGSLEKSLNWQRTGVKKDMPPKSVKDRPTDAELETLKKWISDGAKPK